MDSNIRQLLSFAQRNIGIKKNSALTEAYDALRHVAEKKPTVDAPEAFSQDLYVLCAEIALQNGLHNVSKECLKMFFMKAPPANQFLCRAYLCQAQLLAPKSAANTDQLEKAVVYILKAISFAKENPRYHFLVYNASVLYWQFCRPFLKPNYRQYLARSLHQVVKALDDMEDKDYEWRAMLMIALIECHLDAGRRNDASHIAAAAASFIRQNVPHLYKQVFGLMVRNQLVESTKLARDLKNPELAVYYKVCKLKLSLDVEESRDYNLDIEQILYQLGVIREEPKQSADAKKSRQKMGVTGKGSPGGEDERKSPMKGGRRTPTPTTAKRVATDSNEKPYLLLEVARLCIDLDFADLANTSLDHIRNCVVKDSGFYLEAEFLQCQLMVKKLREKQENYMKSSVDVRLQAIRRCEEAIMNAIRNGNPNIIQVGCTTQFNLCLPLVQPNLRHHVRKPLTLVAEALEDIDSLLIQLRCQVHTELAKCEEEEEQMEVAMGHLRKALSLDDGDVYHERLQVSLHRLQLCSQLYTQPDRPEDQAAMIIEQARKADSGTMRMKRSLLVKAGEALAPDAFLLVLDSESDTKEVTSVKGPMTVIKKLAGKARQFMKCVAKVDGHLKRLGNENDRERARLWSDLAKTARKQEVWDVCRVAARFTLLYDDGRWKTTLPLKPENTGKPTKQRMESSQADSDMLASQSQMSGTVDDKRPGSHHGSRPTTPEPVVPLYDKDLIRMLAEVNFINGEAQIHMLRSEGIQLNDKPIPPEDKSKRPKGYVAKKPEEDPDWLIYCEWIKSLSDASTKTFLRALELGTQLREAWIVCSASAYIWNYNNHVLTQTRHAEIIEHLQACLDGLKKVGHAGETMLLVNICNALAYAYITPWIPVEGKDLPASPSPSTQDKGKGAKPASIPTKLKSASITISPDAGPDLKKAIEVCDYCLHVTNGDRLTDLVPVSVRLPLLQTWVLAKQMSQIQINKCFGTDDETSIEGQRAMTRCIVAVEMFQLSKNRLMEFKDAPTLVEIAQMMEDCDWADHFIELQLWVRLTALSYNNNMPNLVARCSKMALRFAVTGTQAKNRKQDQHIFKVEQEMYSYAYGLLGQSIMENMKGKQRLRREAMQAFVNSAKHARDANNNEMVMTAARHYWNAIIPLVSQPIERELVKEPIKLLLHFINETTEKTKKKEDDDDSDEEGENDTTAVGSDVKDAAKLHDVPTIGNPDDDLTLRAALYGVLFQSYADKGEWEEGLKAMDQAVADMPRTKHRLLIFKHRVIVKAKLGRQVHMDIAKFRDEHEDFVAQMWRRVALCSVDTMDQLKCYQQAIEALESPESVWQKVDYLIEFGQWLYVNQFPVEEASDVVEWAADIIIHMAKGDAENTLIQKSPAHAVHHPKAKKEKKRGKSSPKARNSQSQVLKSTSQTSSQSDGKKTDKDSGEINAADYIPVTKKAVIGIPPATQAATIQDISDIKQLETLVRIYVLLAEIHGQGSSGHKHSCLLAYGCLLRIWQISIPACGPVIKEMAKTSTEDSGGKGSAKSKKKDPKDAPKEKPKRKVPVDVIPTSIEDWASYELSDEMVDAFKHESMKKSGVNSTTISKPLLTLYYVDVLIKQLRELGFSHMTLPILAFTELLSKDLIKSKPLNMLVHLRALEVCIELNLKTAANFHEKLAGAVNITEEDQAESRQRIAIWKEKQAQVAREELRVKEVTQNSAAPGGRKSPEPKRNKGSSLSKGKKSAGFTRNTENPTKVDSECHLGRTIGSVCIREIWADIADMLLRQGMYQRAREYLGEAYTEAVAFGDSALLGQILAKLGRLAYIECQYGLASTLCITAQEVHKGDEMFWCDTVLILVNATLNNVHDRNRNRKARSLLVGVMNVFLNMSEEKPNRESAIGLILAKMEAKLGSIQVVITCEEYKDLNVPKVMSALLSACQKFENATERLLRFGYRREAAPIMKEHAALLQRMARTAIEPEIKHTYYLQSLAVLKDLVAVSEDVFYEAQTLAPLMELRSVSLPVQRELADSQLLCGEVMVEMMALHVEEERAKQLEDHRKGTVLRMVEELVRGTPDYTQMEKEWVESAKVIADGCLVQLINAHNTAKQIAGLKARSLCLIGQCLRLLSLQQHPDPPSSWHVADMELMKILGQIEEGQEAGVELEQSQEEGEEKMDVKCPKNIATLLDKQKVSKQYMLQATECLAQAINLALSKGLKDVASRAALELVDCFGQYDPSAASHYLALHQSCETALTLKRILYDSQPDPASSRLAALLHQRAAIIRDDITTNMSEGSFLSNVESSLEQDWQAWKRLAVLPQHLDFLKEFPTNFTFVILQHSPDKTKLYGSLMDKSKGQTGAAATSTTTKTDSKKPGMQGLSRARIVSVDTNPFQLEELIERFRSHKHSTQQALLQQEYVRSQQAQRQKMLENLDDDMKQDRMSSASGTLSSDAELHDEFLDLVSEMETYLRPVLTTLDTYLRPQTATTNSNSHTKDPSTASQECLILLADPTLMEMPLEALHILQSDSIASLSRDFSLQFFYHRYHVDVPDAEVAASGKKAKVEKPKDIPPRIPGLKDANKKQAKIIPLNRQLQPWCQSVDTMNFRFMVDPYLDCAETETHAPIETMKKFLEEYEQLFTPRWLGVMGDDHVPSVGEWEIYLSEGSSFVYYGMEGFLANIPPSKMSSLNIPDCMIAYVLDMAQTSKSFLRQSKIDVLKDGNSLRLEKPVERIMLVSLAGVKCVVANQWHCTLEENCSKFKANMKDMLTEGLPTGQATRLLFTPYRRKQEPVEEEENKAASPEKEGEEEGRLESQQDDHTEGGSTLMEPLPEQSWYNMVCYGLPNLVITQV